MNDFIERHHSKLSLIVGILALPPFAGLISQAYTFTTEIGWYAILNPEKSYWFYLSSIAIAALVWLFLRLRPINPAQRLSDNSPYLISIVNLVADYLSKQGYPISHLNLKSPHTTYKDILQVYSKLLYSEHDQAELRKILRDARSYAYTKKYGEPRESDEKRRTDTGLKDWKIYFNTLLREIGLENLAGKEIINVGIGNAYESNGLFPGAKIVGVDISKEALEYAKGISPKH